jgi:hypothetical protein
MRVRVWRRKDLYDVMVTGAPGRTRPWRSGEPLSAIQAVTCLEQLGCEPTDVAVAMFDADPLWMERLIAELDVVKVPGDRRQPCQPPCPEALPPALPR